MGIHSDEKGMRKGRSPGGSQSWRGRGLYDDRNERAVGGYVARGSTCYSGSTSSAPNATTSTRVAERATSPRAYIRTAP